MIIFFKNEGDCCFAVELQKGLNSSDKEKLHWIFGNSYEVKSSSLEGTYIGPRKEMITPWSTNAVEITKNMGISGIARIEEYFRVESLNASYDPMLQSVY